MNNNHDLDQNREPVIEESTEQPLQESSDVTPAKQVATSNKGLLITLISLVALLLALGAVYLFWYLPNKTEETPMKTAHETHSMTAREIITETDTYITTHLEATTEPMEGISPTYRPAGANVSVASSVDQVIAVTPKGVDTTFDRERDNELYEKVITYLEKTHMLTRTDTNEDKTLTTLTSDEVTCAVDARFDPLTVTCEDNKTLMKVAEELKPFIDGYPSSTSVTTIYNLEYQKSNTDGYQLATVSVTYGGSGATSLFYKKGDADWKYFASAQAALPCTDYNTDDLKNAYAGTICQGDDVDVETRVEAAKTE